MEMNESDHERFIKKGNSIVEYKTQFHESQLKNYDHNNVNTTDFCTNFQL